MAKYRDRTRAVQHAYEGKEDVLPLLMECFRKEEVGAWRATLLDLMDSWAHEPAVQELAAGAVNDPDALTRAAAAKVMGRANNPSAGKLPMTLSRSCACRRNGPCGIPCRRTAPA